MKIKIFTFILLFSILKTNAQVFPSGCTNYQEANGVVLMEAENADLSGTNWVLRTDANITNYYYEKDGTLTSGPHEFEDSFVGTGFIEYQGDDSFGSQEDNPITYTFTIDTPGTYRLIFRGYKNHLDPDGPNPINNKNRAAKFAWDRNNDVWIKMEGDYDANTAYDNGAQESDLREYNKFIGRGDTGWGQTGSIEPSSGVFKGAYYQFKAGETYQLSVVGRSNQYNIDRIMLLRYLDENNQDVPEILIYTNPSNGNQQFRDIEKVYLTGYKFREVSSKGYLNESDFPESTCASEDAEVSEDSGIGGNSINLEASNVLTPNGDGENDFWQVEGLNSSSRYNVKIFTNAGQVIYDSEDIFTNPWDGTNEGQELSEGVYYYFIELKDTEQVETGYITLIR